MRLLKVRGSIPRSSNLFVVSTTSSFKSFFWPLPLLMGQRGNTLCSPFWKLWVYRCQRVPQTRVVSGSRSMHAGCGYTATVIVMLQGACRGKRCVELVNSGILESSKCVQGVVQGDVPILSRKPYQAVAPVALEAACESLSFSQTCGRLSSEQVSCRFQVVTIILPVIASYIPVRSVWAAQACVP